MPKTNTFGLRDIFRRIFAEELSVFALFVVNSMLLYQGDEVPLGVAAQGGLAKVWVGRYEVIRRDHVIGEITASATGHENFLADLVGFFQQQYTPPAAGRRDCTHQASSTRSDDDDVMNGHLVLSSR